MITDKINSLRKLNFEPQVNIEQEMGWHKDLSLEEIGALLENRPPYSYVITPLTPPFFLLSFVRNDDQGIVHVQFDQTKQGQWHYRNGADNIHPHLKKLIRKMMHLEEPMLEPTPVI